MKTCFFRYRAIFAAFWPAPKKCEKLTDRLATFCDNSALTFRTRRIISGPSLSLGTQNSHCQGS
jgi:hypothetical protein